MQAKRCHRSVVVVCLIVMMMVSLAGAQYGGGLGEPNDPYLIETVGHLQELAAEPNDWSKHFRLTADLDLAGIVYTRAVVAWDSDGLDSVFDGTRFAGTFDGDGHSIAHLTIDVGPAQQGNDYLGLFGALHGHAVLRNLRLVDAAITGGTNSDHLGALAGLASGATIENCRANVEIQCQFNCTWIGGLIGRGSTGRLSDCEVTCTIAAGQGSGYLGGLVGETDGTDFVNCQVSGSVAAGAECYNLGGLAGYAGDYGTGPFDMTRCHAEATISGGVAGFNLGGLIGSAHTGILEGCYATGTVSGETLSRGLGGLIGYVVESQLTDCHSEATVQGEAGAYALGGFAGQSHGTSFSDCYAEGPVLGGTNSDLLGGFGGSVLADATPTGYRNGKLIRCRATGAVTGQENSDHVGGLLGFNGREVLVYACVSSGAVHAEEEVGGLVGYNSGMIIDCHSESPVTGAYDADRLGGLVGRNDDAGTIQGCCATGSITGAYNSDHLGGFAGRNAGTISDCYAVGPVSGGQEAEDLGGFVGLNNSAGSRIDRCYCTGLVSSLSTAPSIGGFVGQHRNGVISSCYWNTETSAQADGVGLLDDSQDGNDVTGLTAAEMHDAGVFTASGWGFVDAATMDYSAAWMTVDDSVGPVLQWQSDLPIELPAFSGGSGTSDDPYLIATADDLNQIGRVPALMDKHFLVTADITMTGPDELKMIGDELRPFTGVFDGDRHVLDIQVPVDSGPYDDHMGLFGCLAGNAEVSRLNLTLDLWVPDSEEYLAVGGLAGYVGRGSITACQCEGTISGQDCLGGLVGCNGQGEISYCNSAVIVSGHDSVGGLVGLNNGTITASYATADVAGRGKIGGLVGENNGPVAYCYSTAPVSGSFRLGGLVGDSVFRPVSASFWNIETSGQSDSQGGVGLTTAEMQTAATFLEAGWDFVDETANGTEDIWWMPAEPTYPRLWWQDVD